MWIERKDRGMITENKPLITMVVLNRPDLTEQVWKNLEKTVKVSDVLVVDNGSEEETKKLLVTLAEKVPLPGLRVVRWDKTLPNIAAAVNFGWALGFWERAPLLIKLDNDILPTEGWDQELWEITKLTKVGLAAIPVYPGIRPGMLKEMMYQEKRVQRPVSTRGIRFVWGGCCAVSREVAEIVGLLDESLPRDEDWEYSQRMAAKTYNVFYSAEKTAKNLEVLPADDKREKVKRSQRAMAVLAVRRGVQIAKVRWTAWKIQEAVRRLEKKGDRYWELSGDVVSFVRDEIEKKLENATFE